MILLDTNILSEFMRPRPAPQVVTWLDAQPAEQVWVSAITRAEIGLGIALLPDGQRKQGLQKAANALFLEDFASRCLAFDETAAQAYAEIVALRIRCGRPMSVEDGQIASIALVHGLTLATRNTRDFEEIEALSLFNPWQGDS